VDTRHPRLDAQEYHRTQRKDRNHPPVLYMNENVKKNGIDATQKSTRRAQDM